MQDMPYRFSLFTKHWNIPSAELGAFVAALGFDGVEFPVRPGFEVTPENVGEKLPRVAKELSKHGVKILSIAGPTDEGTIAACGEAGIPFIRVMVQIPEGGSYLETVDATRREYERLIPVLEKHKVAIGVQNHCGRFVANAGELRHLLAGFDPRHVCAVWDAAHEAIAGTGQPEFAIEMLEPWLRIVNLKNAYWKRVTGPEAEDVEWVSYWTSGRQGMASWPRVAKELKRRHWQGIVCVTAEYSDDASRERLLKEDFAYARRLFEQECSENGD
jgi:sugar phosphate isomerase/epimerase